MDYNVTCNYIKKTFPELDFSNEVLTINPKKIEKNLSKGDRDRVEKWLCGNKLPFSNHYTFELEKFHYVFSFINNIMLGLLLPKSRENTLTLIEMRYKSLLEHC